MIRTATFIAVSLVVTGCAIGQQNFSCNGLPEGITCMSATEVYNATNGDKLDRSKNGKKKDEVVTRTVTLGGYTPPPDRPVPVRTEPEILRVLVYPWEDEAGRLDVGGYVFAEVTPRKWSVGDVPHAGTRVLHSINDSSVSAGTPTSSLSTGIPAAVSAAVSAAGTPSPHSSQRAPTAKPAGVVAKTMATADSKDSSSKRADRPLFER